MKVSTKINTDLLSDEIAEAIGKVYVYIDCLTMFYFVGRFDTYEKAYNFMQSVDIDITDWKVIYK